jgi:hypothetical protein
MLFLSENHERAQLAALSDINRDANGSPTE